MSDPGINLKNSITHPTDLSPEFYGGKKEG